MPRPESFDRGISFGKPAVWLFALLVATVLVYLPGLNGPFLFDDPPNLILPINAWLSGQTGWHEVLLGNRSGLLGRPLSMLSFIANAATTGLAPLPFKATNLAIHLLCGLLIYVLISRVLTRDPQLRTRAKLAALLVSAVWLLHPMQVSTVLYIVQRMAQLSTMFMLLGLLVFVLGREALEQGHTRKGAATAVSRGAGRNCSGHVVQGKRCAGSAPLRCRRTRLFPRAQKRATACCGEMVFRDLPVAAGRACREPACAASATPARRL